MVFVQKRSLVKIHRCVFINRSYDTDLFSVLTVVFAENRVALHGGGDIGGAAEGPHLVHLHAQSKGYACTHTYFHTLHSTHTYPHALAHTTVVVILVVRQKDLTSSIFMLKAKGMHARTLIFIHSRTSTYTFITHTHSRNGVAAEGPHLVHLHAQGNGSHISRYTLMCAYVHAHSHT